MAKLDVLAKLLVQQLIELDPRGVLAQVGDPAASLRRLLMSLQLRPS